jgi:hypothetical protein
MDKPAQPSLDHQTLANRVAGAPIASVDFSAPAGVYLNSPLARGRQRSTSPFRRFATLAEAIRFVIEDLPSGVHGASIEVGDQRLDMEQIWGLYDDDAYPLERRPEEHDAYHPGQRSW